MSWDGSLTPEHGLDDAKPGLPGAASCLQVKQRGLDEVGRCEAAISGRGLPAWGAAMFEVCCE